MWFCVGWRPDNSRGIAGVTWLEARWKEGHDSQEYHKTECGKDTRCLQRVDWLYRFLCNHIKTELSWSTLSLSLCIVTLRSLARTNARLIFFFVDDLPSNWVTYIIWFLRQLLQDLPFSLLKGQFGELWDKSCPLNRIDGTKDRLKTNVTGRETLFVLKLNLKNGV